MNLVFEICKCNDGKTLLKVLLNANEYQEKPYYRVFVDEKYEAFKKLIEI